MQKGSIVQFLVPLQQSLLPPMVGFIDPQAKVILVSSYVWNLGTFHLSTTRNPNQGNQSCILQQPTHTWYHKNRETCTDLLHKYIAFTYLSPAFYYYPTIAKDMKRISAKFKQWQDINQEREKGLLTPTRAMAPLTCKLWQDWISVTFPDLWSHRCEGSKKNSRHSFSISPAGTAFKTSLKIK